MYVQVNVVILSVSPCLDNTFFFLFFSCFPVYAHREGLSSLTVLSLHYDVFRVDETEIGEWLVMAVPSIVLVAVETS